MVELFSIISRIYEQGAGDLKQMNVQFHDSFWTPLREKPSNEAHYCLIREYAAFCCGPLLFNIFLRRYGFGWAARLLSGAERKLRFLVGIWWYLGGGKRLTLSKLWIYSFAKIFADNILHCISVIFFSCICLIKRNHFMNNYRSCLYYKNFIRMYFVVELAAKICESSKMWL